MMSGVNKGSAELMIGSVTLISAGAVRMVRTNLLEKDHKIIMPRDTFTHEENYYQFDYPFQR